MKHKLSTRRAILILVLALYIATWTFGVPALYTDVTREQGDAYYTFRWAVPVLPFVILSWHKYVRGPTSGWGGLCICVWYITGAKEVCWAYAWIS